MKEACRTIRRWGWRPPDAPAGLGCGDVAGNVSGGARVFRGGVRFRFCVDSPAATHSLTEDPFDLAIQAAEVVRSPALQLAPERRVDAQEE